jgi:amino acid transporter
LPDQQVSLCAARSGRCQLPIFGHSRTWDFLVGIGTATGRALVDAGLGVMGAPSLPWDEYFGGFETLLAGSAPIFWAFFLLTGVAVVLLRKKQPTAQRPFSIPLYPLPLIIFCATCLYMLYSSVVYARWLVLVVATPLVLGAALWFVIRGRDDQ